MRLCKPHFEILEQQPGLEGIYKQIELVGRTCYKSEDKITEDSAKEFVDRMIKSGHGAVLEHGTVYLAITYNPEIEEERKHISKYLINPHTATTCKILESEHIPLSKQKLGEPIKVTKSIVYVTTNYRVIVENNLQDDLKYLCEPTEYHEKRYTVKFICDRGILAEFTRHRKFSFMAESTRYCNYSKDKFNNEITYIIPCWMNLEEGSYNNGKYYNPIATPYLVKGTPEEIFLLKLVGDELDYFELLEKGWKPQQARTVLPNALKTELVMTGFIHDWEHFFSLRALGTTGAPHPQAKELAEPLMKEFERRGLLCTTQ